MHLPRATYRFQFNEHFRLAQALALVPYLHELGISHVYASPLFRAAPHSAHGYDVCDFSRLNPELGTEANLEKLVHALHGKNLGLILDIVPNHMGVSSPENGWWWDVLAQGESSPYASFFDINWRSPEDNLAGKVLLPILGDHYEAILKKGELQLLFEQNVFVLGYHEHRLPLAPATTVKLPADPGGLKKINADFAALDKLIQRQNYCLAYHALGDARINYRRFFAVNSLAAVRVEEPKVFAAVHGLVRRWIEKGWLDGLRVDHPDGLRDPEKYLAQLRGLAPGAWIVVEKILGPAEQLPASWPVAGTTGYDFLNQLNGLQVDPGAEKALTGGYADFTGETTDYPPLIHDKKRAVLETLFVAEWNRLTGLLAALAARRKQAAHFSHASLQAALAEIIICFPVYRSYVPDGAGRASPADLAVIDLAVQVARQRRNDLPPEIFALVHSLFLETPRRRQAQDFVSRFQQLTGAVMAKGVEDTACYCFNRFTSLNEVGGDPGKFGASPEAFHNFLQSQQKTWPHSQLTTSTHDTKRAEDVRARLNLLSEIPGLWAQTICRWSAMNACHRQDDWPDRNAEYLYYQTLVGAWPLSEERAQFYMEKAAHESKQHTSWTERNLPYEKALQKFISETLRDPEFTADLERFVRTLATPAAVNSLAQTLIKLTAPGVPDIYQGCELWDHSLVDPDNRRPVDFAWRQSLLAGLKSLAVEAVWERRAEGLPKLWLIQKTLKLREQHPDYFEHSYKPLYARGARAEHLFAFARHDRLIAVVPRFILKLNNDWRDTLLPLPAGTWRNEFTGENLDGGIRAEDLFQKFPVALLVRKENI